jgi:hypothetical protein
MARKPAAPILASVAGRVLFRLSFYNVCFRLSTGIEEASVGGVLLGIKQIWSKSREVPMRVAPQQAEG